MSVKTRFVMLLALLTVAGLMLTACAAPAAPAVTEEQPAAETAAQPAPGGVLTVGLGSEPETLDPGDAVYVQEQLILMNLFDSLLAMAPDGTLHPGLASAWQANEDFSEFTFTLREDVTFHDGTPFTAAAVQASFDHIVSDAVLESGGKTLLVDHQYVETEVVDDYTAVVKFAAPYPTFLRDAAPALSNLLNLQDGTAPSGGWEIWLPVAPGSAHALPTSTVHSTRGATP